MLGLALSARLVALRDVGVVGRYQLNDEANALLAALPSGHPGRERTARQALSIPGRPGYLYFGALARLPYIVEAAHGDALHSAGPWRCIGARLFIVILRQCSLLGSLGGLLFRDTWEKARSSWRMAVADFQRGRFCIFAPWGDAD